MLRCLKPQVRTNGASKQELAQEACAHTSALKPTSLAFSFSGGGFLLPYFVVSILLCVFCLLLSGSQNCTSIPEVVDGGLKRGCF